MKLSSLLTRHSSPLLTLGLLALIGIIASPITSAQDPVGAEMTVITSEKLTFDYRESYAIFEENVVVKDPGMNMTCDRMEVFFDKDNQVRQIKAKGNVYLQQDDFTAKAGLATYDVVTQMIDLELAPQIIRGQDLMKATRISYDRANDRVKGDGNVQVFLIKRDDQPATVFGAPRR